jgi:hypothetical protein
VLVTVVLMLAIAAAANICRDQAVGSGGCCRLFDFQAPGTNGATHYTQNIVSIASGAAGPWHVNGIEISVAEVDPSSNQHYALGLFNASLPKSVLQTLPLAGGDTLHSASEHMALAAFNPFSTALLHNTQTLVFKFTRQPACVASLTALRSVDLPYRQEVGYQIYNASAVEIDADLSAWRIGLPGPEQTFEPTKVAHADELHVRTSGLGYGAVSRVELCYFGAAGFDACHVCGGDGTSCPLPGSPCTTGMSGICFLGKYNDSLVCVPNMAYATEVCNGIDDNCDGIIDNGNFGVWTCGLGQCERNISRCQNGFITQANASGCVPGTPVAEVCNGLDDDCDGVIDNGDVCASPSPSSVPAPTPSPSAAPQRPILQPRLDCVRPAPGAASAQAYEALFGYQLFGPGAVPLDLPAGGSSNLLTVDGVPNAAAGGVVQPTHFEPGDARRYAMVVPFAGGQTVQWHLDSQTAFADAGSTPCSAVSQLRVECVQPRRQGCVARIGGTCTVGLGYYNPNPQTVELAVEAGVNWVQPGPIDRRQPRLFFPGQLDEATVVEFDCSQSPWAFNWTLAVGAQAQSVVFSQADLC